MNLINALYKNNKRWIVRKLAQAIIGSILLVLVASIWFKQESDLAKSFSQNNYATAQEFSRILTQRFIYMDGFEQASDVLNYMVLSERIIDATLYDNQGNPLASSVNNLSIADATGLNPYGSVKVIPTVTEIFDQDDSLLGYLRISFDNAKFQQPQDDITNKISSNGRLMLFLAALAGVFFSRSFYRQTYFRSSEDLNSDLKASNKITK